MSLNKNVAPLTPPQRFFTSSALPTGAGASGASAATAPAPAPADPVPADPAPAPAPAADDGRFKVSAGGYRPGRMSGRTLKVSAATMEAAPEPAAAAARGEQAGPTAPDSARPARSCAESALACAERRVSGLPVLTPCLCTLRVQNVLHPRVRRLRHRLRRLQRP